MKLDGIGIEIDINDIELDDMPNDDFKDIYEICGVEVALTILTYFTGTNITVPVKAFDRIKKKIIKNQYDGTRKSIKRLCRELGMTERTVTAIISEMGVTPPTEGQMSLFGEDDE